MVSWEIKRVRKVSCSICMHVKKKRRTPFWMSRNAIFYVYIHNKSNSSHSLLFYTTTTRLSSLNEYAPIFFMDINYIFIKYILRRCRDISKTTYTKFSLLFIETTDYNDEEVSLLIYMLQIFESILLSGTHC